jgi:hypothetical protein
MPPSPTAALRRGQGGKEEGRSCGGS